MSQTLSAVPIDFLPDVPIEGFGAPPIIVIYDTELAVSNSADTLDSMLLACGMTVNPLDDKDGSMVANPELSLVGVATVDGSTVFWSALDPNKALVPGLRADWDGILDLDEPPVYAPLALWVFVLLIVPVSWPDREIVDSWVTATELAGSF